MNRPSLTAIGTGVVLAVVLTYPTMIHPASMARMDTDDGKFSMWNVAWVAHALMSNPRHLFDANIFYPHRDTLAYSEANLVAGAIATPVYAATRNPVAAYNFVVFAVFLASFLAMWALVRRLTGVWTGALVAATAFAFSPYAQARTAHIQLLMVFVFPVVLLAFHRFAEAPGLRRGAVLGASLALAGLACGYYGIFAGLAVGLAAVWFAPGQVSQGRYWRGLALAGLVAAALVAPAFQPYLTLRAQSGLRQALNLEEAAGYAADGPAYFTSPSRLHQWLRERAGLAKSEGRLFPGIIACSMAILGLLTLWRPRSTTVQPSLPRPPGRVVAFYGVLALLAGWASFGPAGGLYAWLVRIVPFMSFLRAPERFGVVVVFALAVVAGYGLASLIGRVEPRRRGWVTAALVAITAAELSAPWRLSPVPPVPDVYRRLAELPRGAVVEFHFPYKSTDLFRHSRYMFWSMWHWQPLINGYSDYIPQDYRDMAVPINSFPSPRAFQILRAHDARYVVVHLDTYNDPRGREEILARYPPYGDYLRPILQTNDTWLFEIMKWPE